ncbi:prepilin-type N-terminal cleavage/methylation domain-containing protein [Patescibacteria group bacterium]|nr:prepilin-type N-terminal cleavage/methylation domain-containing protein [Patescibacteria group bacterium]MCL5091856.1 prepilin-type N-terminal cleavage/methylation domain-containing protein [Patescibacteria group bacterium]
MKKGFTLIELLIVIALLGALAVGLLAALDPFEQLKKGTDTGTRNTVSEIHGAVVRYFAIKNNMPWCPSGTGGAGCTASFATANLNQAPMSTAITEIVQTGELKSDFTSLASSNLDKIFVSGDLDTVTVCFKPLSKSFQKDSNTKYNQNGTDATGCKSQTVGAGGTDCYWCVQ